MAPAIAQLSMYVRHVRASRATARRTQPLYRARSGRRSNPWV